MTCQEYSGYVFSIPKPIRSNCNLETYFIASGIRDAFVSAYAGPREAVLVERLLRSVL